MSRLRLPTFIRRLFSDKAPTTRMDSNYWGHGYAWAQAQPDLQCKMGQAGRARVERYFNVERMVQQTEALYEELIRGKMGLEWAEGKGWQAI